MSAAGVEAVAAAVLPFGLLRASGRQVVETVAQRW